MIARRYRPLVLVAVGLLFVVSPLYLFPQGVPYEDTYSLRAERVDDPGSALRDTEGDRILHCDLDNGPHEQRSCAFESLAGPTETLELRNHTLSDGVPEGLEAPYAFVFDSEAGYHEPRARAANGSVTLSLEPVSAGAVADELVGRSYRSAPDGVRRAIDTGNATASVRYPADGLSRDRRSDRLDEYVGTVGELVQRNGSYYRVSSGVAAERAFPPALLWAARVALFLVGLYCFHRADALQRDLTDAE